MPVVKAHKYNKILFKTNVKIDLSCREYSDYFSGFKVFCFLGKKKDTFVKFKLICSGWMLIHLKQDVKLK